MPFPLAFIAAGAGAGLVALVFGYFCVRLTKIYFAMLTLAFAQIVWAVCFKWNDVTGGQQGLSNVPYPDLGWMSVIPGLGELRVGGHYFYLTLLLVGLCFLLLKRITGSPFGRPKCASRMTFAPLADSSLMVGATLGLPPLISSLILSSALDSPIPANFRVLEKIRSLAMRWSFI